MRVGVSRLGWTENDLRVRVMTTFVSPSSGDCDQGLDQSSPRTASGGSRFRWQRPKVIENANVHEPAGLTKSANGSQANRANEPNHGRASRARAFARRRHACHSLPALCTASAPPVQATLRLACSLRSRRSAWTGPGSDAGDPRDEGMAGFAHCPRDHPQLNSLDIDRPSHGSPCWARRCVRPHNMRRRRHLSSRVPKRQ